MKVVILSGSPKGDESVSLQSMNFVAKKNPEHTYEVFHISQTIKKIEKDTETFNRIIASVTDADLVMWVSPVYTFLIPAQLKRFIELISEKNATDAFKEKPAAVIMTSINFFDHCAVNYMRSICEDLDMSFCGSFAADSFDLLEENERIKLDLFGKQIFDRATEGMPLQKAFQPVNYDTRDYTPQKSNSSKAIIDLKGKRLIVITDKAYTDTNTDKMILAFTRQFSGNVDIYNLQEVEIKGGCLGCIQCGFDNECIYDGKDSFKEFFNTCIKDADIIVFAGEIKDRWLSSDWKQFYDRSFFNNHVPVMAGKQLGCLISGPLAQLANLREITEAFAEWQRANLVDIITDEHTEDTDLDSAIRQLAKGLANASDKGYVKPATFLGKGGHKIFRDDIWGRHRFVFQVDHHYYEENGFYDFPQYDEKIIETNKNMMALTEDPEMRKAVRKMLKSEMVKPHIKIVEES